MTFLFRYFEEIFASIAISITVIMVILNVFLRYGFGFVIPWTEELSVICFIWATYLGGSSCYKHKLHLGVDIIISMLPEGMRQRFQIMLYLFLLALHSVMVWLSFDYLMLSSKSTPVMGISYFYINSVLVLSFGLMVLHTLRFLAQEISALRNPQSQLNTSLNGAAE
ncbi:TRAP transporter small permease [Sansalvadorimonas verongulae]|uniref:TRAP transporter small permease n=1 Tax=Sansalvadorimonas verongulae TaxID=2172824 RepID=UPI0012BC0478|nr:TRAP transporter small permease [Sansalvadorimonas verongulae]MTI13920.1 TRAP transporter small permease [Sansalvadorimonas verongulae]